MTIPSKNYNLAIATIVTITTITIAAVAQADPNPYVQGKLIAEAEKTTQNGNAVIQSPAIKKQTIQKKIKITQPGGAAQSFVKEGPIFVKDGGKLPGINKVIQPGGAVQSFVKESGPIFVKDGGKLPGINKVIQPGAAKSNSKFFPSAVEIEKEIRSTEHQ